MANEISVTASISVFKAGVMGSPVGRSAQDRQFNMTGTLYAQDTILVATSATLIPVGQLVTPHWAWFENLDATNFIKIRNGASGADVLRIRPGEAFPCPLEPTGTYYAIADTAACSLEYLIFAM